MTDPERFHLETAIGALDRGRRMFDDLVDGSPDLLVENLYALTEGSLQEIVFERVVAERGARRLGR